MLHTRRFLSFVAVVAVLIATLAETAAPALAAGITLYVGGPAKCGKTPYATLQEAVTAASTFPANMKKTIIICTGTYSISSTVDIGVSNLTIKGRKNAVITTPAAIADPVIVVDTADNVTITNLTFKPGSGYSNNGFLHVVRASGFKARKLIIDGGGDVSGAAIRFLSVSGDLLNNKILNWHDAGYTSAHNVIEVNGKTVGETVRINKNVIDDYSGMAISVGEVGSLTMTGNQISGTAVTSAPVAAGGMAVYAVSGGRISSNKITGGAFPTVASGMAAGISISASSALKVTGNRITHWDVGIYLEGGCSTDPDANHTITRNRIQEVMRGFLLESISQDETCAGTLDNLTIRGNTIKDTVAEGGTGIDVVTVNYDYPGTIIYAYIRNALVKGNTITHFSTAMSTPLPNDPYITGVFGPNKIK